MATGAKGSLTSTCICVSHIRSVAGNLELTLVSFWPEHHHYPLCCPFPCVEKQRDPLENGDVQIPEVRGHGPGHSLLWKLEAQVSWPEMSLPGSKWAFHLCDLQSQQAAHHIILTSLQNNVQLFNNYIHSEFFL